MAKTRGFRQAINALRRYDANVKREAKAELKRIGDEILAQALARVPVDSGELRASLGIEVQNGGWRVIVYADAPHAPYQEFGTGRKATELLSGYPPDVGEYAYDNFYVSGKGTTDAQPFLFPPFLAVREQVAQRVEKILVKLASEFNRM